jgi:hypothetical protein
MNQHPYYDFIKTFVELSINDIVYREYFEFTDYSRSEDRDGYNPKALYGDIHYKYKNKQHYIYKIGLANTPVGKQKWIDAFCEIFDDDILIKMQKYILEHI